MLILNALTGFGAGAGSGWTALDAAGWLGDTGSYTLGTGIVTVNVADTNIRTAVLVKSFQDFDLEGLAVSGSPNFCFGFSTSGSLTGYERPTNTDPIVYARDYPDPYVGALSGWGHGYAVADATRAKAWTTGRVIRLSRRGSTFHGYLDGVLDRTIAGVSTNLSGKFFIGCNGAVSGWTLSGLRYRILNPGPVSVDLTSQDFLGDTGSFSWSGSNVTNLASDRNVRTANVFVSENQDFEFSADIAGAAGFVMGFATGGTSTGASQPTSSNPVVYAKSQGTGPGWNSGNGTVEAARAAGWCAGRTIGIHRRGSTLYGYLDGSSDHAFAVSTGAAGLVFFGCDGSGSGWVGNNVRITLR
jgi:hypothetical protein